MLVTGPPGSGVGTLLRTVVDGLAVIYPPEECQTLLVGVGSRRPFTALRRGSPPSCPAGDERGRPRARALGARGNLGHRRSPPRAPAGGRHRSPRSVRAPPADRRAGAAAGAGPRRRGRAADPGGWPADDASAAMASSLDAIGSAALELLGRLAEEGPAHGVHLVLADRVAGEEQQDLAAVPPAARSRHGRGAGRLARPRPDALAGRRRVRRPHGRARHLLPGGVEPPARAGRHRAGAHRPGRRTGLHRDAAGVPRGPGCRAGSRSARRAGRRRDPSGPSAGRRACCSANPSVWAPRSRCCCAARRGPTC